MRTRTALCTVLLFLECISFASAQQKIDRTFIANALKLKLSTVVVQFENPQACSSIGNGA